MSKVSNYKSFLSRRSLLITLLITSTFIFTVFYHAYKYSKFLTRKGPSAHQQTYPPVQLQHNFFSISSSSFSSDQIINTQGYVVHINECHCPPGAQCKCVPPQIVISEDKKRLENLDGLTNKEMVLDVETPAQFELGELYQFTIELDLNGDESFAYNRARLIAYTKINRITDFFDLPSNISRTSDETIIKQISKLEPQMLQCKVDEVHDLIVNYYPRIISCQTDADCVVTRPSCSGSTIVNQTWKDTIEYLYDQADACKKCIPPQIGYDNIRCINNECKGSN